MTRRTFGTTITGAMAVQISLSASEKRDFFFRPSGAWAADFIPFYWNDKFYLFYLHDWRDRANHGEGTPWFLIETNDFVHFTERGQMLERGAEDQQDLYVFTGSVLHGRDGRFHIFYTGHNPHLRAQGKPQQAVLHATSADLIRWEKVSSELFFAPSNGFERNDWRDPFVFWNGQAGEYWMLLAARFNNGASRRRGCTALAASRDLRAWEVREPFWSPGLYYTHECPDLFQMGDWWYLLFSEFSDGFVTRYRISRSLSGPWLTPENDTFDGRAFYAAKTASDGRARFLFGWNPTREGNHDNGRWQWGGNLVVHQLVQQSDGTLGVQLPAAVKAAISDPGSVRFGAIAGRIEPSGNSVRLSAPGAFACASAGVLPQRARIDLTLDLATGTRRAGVMLRSDADFEKGYSVRLEPIFNRLVFDRWPRPSEVPFMAELERPLKLAPGRPVPVTILVDDSVCEVYIDGGVAMSARMYDLREGNWGVFVEDGNLSVEQAHLYT